MHHRLIWTNVLLKYNAVNLKSLSKQLMNDPLLKSVSTDSRFEVTKIGGHTTQHQQRVKAGNQNLKNRLAFYKDKRTTNNKTNKMQVVRLYIAGTYSLGNKEGNLLLNVYAPKKGGNQTTSSVTLRISVANNNIQITTDNGLKNLIDRTIPFVNKLLGSTPKSINNGNLWDISTVAVGEYSLVSPSDGKSLKSKTIRANQAMQIFKKMSTIVKPKGYMFDADSHNRIGKKLSVAYFKPVTNNGKINKTKSYPTVNVYTTGRVQFNGKTDMKTIHSIFKIFLDAFNIAIKDLNISFNRSDFISIPIKRAENKRCRLNTPEAGVNSSCKPGMIPQVRGSKVCCFKQKLRDGTGASILQGFVNANIKAPSMYNKFKNQITTDKINVGRRQKSGAYYIRQPVVKNGVTEYNEWKCNVQRMDNIKNVGRKQLKLDMNRGKKQQLCDRIANKLSSMR